MNNETLYTVYNGSKCDEDRKRSSAIKADGQEMLKLIEERQSRRAEEGTFRCLRGPIQRTPRDPNHIPQSSNVPDDVARSGGRVRV